MKKYLNQNVYDALIERLHFLFNDFPIVYISFSGG
ncbi:TPA: phosphoadenosine phosphosulfate reductase, partial [Streptococcus pyogenes]